MASDINGDGYTRRSTLMKFFIQQVWIDQDALDEPLTREILDRVGSARVLVGNEVIRARQSLDLEPDPFKRGKKILRLVKHRGAFIKPCPGTREYVCCGLQILHIGQGCPMDCRYCALQVYFNRPVLEVFVNTDDLLAELHAHLEANPNRFHRFCTGEFTDSLALEPLTGLSTRLARFVSGCTNASLELKTKTDSVEPLLGLNPAGRVIVGFSVNAPRIASREDRGAAGLADRLKAAVRVQERGYRLAFHFDPIIPLPGWQGEYARVIDEIFRSVEPRAVAWISLGVLRFVPELKDTARSRFGPVPYFHDGFLRGQDGKQRLQVDRRIAVYRHMAERIRGHAPDVRLYLCMESPYVWEKALDIRMETNEALSAYLDAGVA